MGVPGDQPQARDTAPRSGAGSETRVLPWYGQTKETKRGRRDGRKSQCLDSTEEAGELDPNKDPGDGKRGIK